MRTRNEFNRELLLEVQHNGFRTLIYRTLSPSGREVFVSESDMPDCARPDDEGYPMYFSMSEAWASVVRYVSPEGLMRRQVWHEGGTEWLDLTPAYIHPDMRPLVQRSLALATRNAALDRTVTASIGHWLRALTEQEAHVSIGLFNHYNTYRHAS